MTKKLFRVAVEGEVWVMAGSKEEAKREVRQALAFNSASDQLDLDVYLFLPTKTSVLKEKVLDSVPYNADPGDTRTVGDLLNATSGGASGGALAALITQRTGK